MTESQRVPFTRREAFEDLDTFYKTLGTNLLRTGTKEIFKMALQDHWKEVIRRHPEPEEMRWRYGQLDIYFEDHFEHREMVKNWGVPANYFLDIPQRPDKGFKGNFIQNDIREYLSYLKSHNALTTYFPTMFGRFVAYQSSSRDREVVFEVNEKQELSALNPSDFEQACLDFYSFLFKTRYAGDMLSIDVQVRLTRHVMVPFLRRVTFSEVAAFRFEGEYGYCWKRLDWVPFDETYFSLPPVTPREENLPSSVSWSVLKEMIEDQAPSWHEIISRMDNAEAFVAWVGALLTPGVRPQQFVYVHGKGGDGKGSMASALYKTLGDRFMRMEKLPEAEGSRRFFYHELEGKRLLLIPDHPQKSIWTEEIKTLTGDDFLAAEQKGKDRRQIKNDVMTMVYSNFSPKIPRQPYALRRIIYCPIKERAGRVDLDYPNKLRREISSFLSLAILVYKTMPIGGDIAVDSQVSQDEFESSNVDLISRIEDLFHIYPEIDDMKVLEWRTSRKEKLPHLPYWAFAEIIETHLKGYRVADILDVLHGQWKVGSRERVRDGVSQNRVIMGISSKIDMLKGKSVSKDRFPGFKTWDDDVIESMASQKDGQA